MINFNSKNAARRAADAEPPGSGATRSSATNGASTDLTLPARNILAAAQRVLVANGFPGLTLRAIAKESGENSAMVQYYFGNKEGLIHAMIDSAFREDQQEVAAGMRTVKREERLPRFVEGLRTISSSRSYRVFFDVLPYALRSDAFRSRMARAMDWYRQIKLDWLGGDEKASPSQREALLGLAELTTAIVDGLAIQEALDEEFDPHRAYAVLELMLQCAMPALLEAGVAGVASPDSDRDAHPVA